MLLSTWLIGFFFFIKGYLAVEIDVQPKEILALPHQNVSFMCRVADHLQYCRMEVPGLNVLNLNPNQTPYRGAVYYGSGLHLGQCGLSLESVNEENNGEIKCTLGLLTESQESSATMRLIVAREPRPPQLEIQNSDRYWAYKVGDVIHATCIVRDGRPAANISWYLDDELIPNGFLSPPTIIHGNRGDLQTVFQNLTKEVRPSDNGKALKCVAHHPALTSNNVVYRQLNVTYAPIPQLNPIDKFGYSLGKEGIISLVIEANPRPHLEWTIRDQTIKAGGHDSTGRIMAEEIRDLGRGLYEAVLIIADIQKHDTETQYILKVYNDMGSQDYVILISTSPEPEGFKKFFRESINYLEMGVLSIIGIVVAVLLLLVIVFLVIFARVTGRWCFSGSHRAGESSDTESVDVRPKRSRLLPNLSFSFFKKPKPDELERPRSAETIETKVPLEDDARSDEPKEGIVYAELDLVNPNPKPLVKSYDDKTEYAEIVYTQKDDAAPPSQDTKEEGKPAPGS
ncbi:fasciclin-3-like isoform X3 [Photinus pyralis]|uniref:fasciclin-3-like isoform X3 n=1 Tax=Photinus pyralis TaxID=7054 RepID=UPI00126732C6|nr:fasciclin-3-like isoform X3 [Photinus pyralis]